MTGREKSIKRKIIWNTAKGVLQVGFYVVLLSIILVLLNINSSNGVFGYTTRVVISESMEPNIEKNALIIIKLCSIDDIKKDDIVCFKYGNDIIHRVIEIKEVDGEKVIHTKGDNNETPDNFEVTKDMVVGKCVKTFNQSSRTLSKFVSKDGSIDTSALYKSVIIWIAFAGIVIYALIKIVKLIIIIVQAFTSKIDTDKSIRLLEKDIEELYIIEDMIKEINSNTVENKRETKFEYISNKISVVRADYAIKSMHKDVKLMTKKIKNCQYIDKLVNKIENREAGAETNESDNHTT